MGRHYNLPGSYCQEANQQKTLHFPQDSQKIIEVQTLGGRDEKSGRPGARQNTLENADFCNGSQVE